MQQGISNVDCKDSPESPLHFHRLRSAHSDTEPGRNPPDPYGHLSEYRYSLELSIISFQSSLIWLAGKPSIIQDQL